MPSIHRRRHFNWRREFDFVAFGPADMYSTGANAVWRHCSLASELSDYAKSVRAAMLAAFSAAKKSTTLNYYKAALLPYKEQHCFLLKINTATYSRAETLPDKEQRCYLLACHQCPILRIGISNVHVTWNTNYPRFRGYPDDLSGVFSIFSAKDLQLKMKFSKILLLVKNTSLEKYLKHLPTATSSEKEDRQLHGSP